MRGLHHPQVDLHPRRAQHRRLAGTISNHRPHHGEHHEAAHHLLGIPGGDDDHIDVPDGLAEAPQAPHRLHPDHAGDIPERGHHISRHPRGFEDRSALLFATHPESLQGGADVLLGLGTHAGQPRSASASSRLEVGHAAHPQLVAQHHRGLGPDAGDASQLDELYGKLGPQALELLHAPGVDQFPDLAGGARPDPAQAFQILLRHRRHRLVERLDGTRRRLIGPNPEGVAVPLIQRGEPGQFGEVGSDLGVGDHGERMPDTRCQVPDAGCRCCQICQIPKPGIRYQISAPAPRSARRLPSHPAPGTWVSGNR
jgi:hypothetical protein